jgi:glucose dehydrogenase
VPFQSAAVGRCHCRRKPLRWANGKQYALIAAGGHGSFLTKLGD